jgi:Ca-activated chloride channel homolog
MRKISILFCCAFALFSLVAVSRAARADGMLIPVVPDEPAFSVKYHHVKVEIDGQAAKTRIDQVFVSQSSRQIEATYLFPIPEGAAITDFAMDIDGKMTKGEMFSKDEARRIYEDIVRRQKDPALLEYVDRGLFRARVFPIPPHGEKRIVITYQELNTLRGDTYRYVYPLSTERLSSKPIDDVTVNVTITSKNPLKNIYSPSHNISVRRKGDYRAEVSYEVKGDRPARDFELYYSVSRDDIGLTLLTHKSGGEDGFFLFMASPDVTLDEKQIAAKDVIFVVDRTGSMSGEKIEQARGALKFCLRALNKNDRFNVIPFNEAPDPLFKELKPADENNIKKALDLADSIEALGGTNIDEALAAAFKNAGHDGRPVFVIFLTDGLPTVGLTDAATIIKNAAGAAPKNLRLFAFGVGFDVNTQLLDKLTEQHHGTREYVAPGEDIEVKVSDMFRMISNPVLTDIDVDFGAMGAYDIVPQQLPDIFSGSQIIIAGRYRHDGRATVSMTGTAADKKREFKIGINTDEEPRHPFIPPLWAARRIGILLDEIRLHGENKELVEEVVRLSKKYGIITEYTSYLVEEPSMRVAAGTTARDEEAGFAEKKLKAGKAEDTGGWAVAQSRNSQALQAAPSAAGPMEYLDKDQNAVKITNVQQVQGRAFYNDNGVWNDAQYTKDIKVIKIKPFSNAHFAALRSAPELGPLFAQGDSVLVVMGKFAVQTASDGKEELSAAELDEIAKARTTLQ